MEGALGSRLTKKFIIEVDMLNGSIDYENPDDITYSDALGMIEYVKMMIMKQWLEDTQD